ncbi:MAG TPA: hypothetical protein VKS21_08410, partial [Spirochaetota bacterium]|nr:hypothetical protein [Spirochaetota bacterium]
NELKQKITVTQKDKNRLEKEHRVIARSKQEKKIRKKELFKRKITNIDFHIERYNKKIVDNEHNINELSEEISANTDRIEKLNQDINSFQEKIKENIENMAGTPGYMAPELLAEADSKKARDASVSSDIYAMGIVLYIMLTGEKPVNGRLVRPQIVPNWLWHMIKKMLRKNPRHRYKSTDPVIRLLKKKIVLKNQMAQRAIIKQAVVDIKEKTKFSAERTAQSTAISGMTARGTVMAEAPDRTAMATMAKTAVEPAGGTVRSEIKKIKQRVLTSDSSIVKVFTLKQKRRRLLVKLAVFFILAGLLVWEFNSGHISSNIPVLNNAFSRIKVNINLGRVNLNSKEVVYLKLYYFYNPYT